MGPQRPHTQASGFYTIKLMQVLTSAVGLKVARVPVRIYVYMSGCDGIRYGTITN